MFVVYLAFCKYCFHLMCKKNLIYCRRVSRLRRILATLIVSSSFRLKVGDKECVLLQTEDYVQLLMQAHFCSACLARSFLSFYTQPNGCHGDYVKKPRIYFALVARCPQLHNISM
jgi:hypothetical protein